MNDGQHKMKKILIVGGGLVLVIMVALVFLVFRKNQDEQVEYFLELLGEKDMVISQGTEYVEPGYKAYDSKGNDYDQEVMVEGSVNSEITGEYVITYKYKELEEVRKVTVLAKSTQLTFIVLAGEQIIYLRKGEEYVEPGYNVIDSYDTNLKDEVVVSGMVDVNTPGTYKLRYSVVNAVGVEVVAERTIIVESKYHLELNGDSVVRHLLGKEYVDSGCGVYDERGDKVDAPVTTNGSVNVNKAGTYTLTYSMSYQGYEEKITRTVQVYEVKCSGIVNRYGTKLTVSGAGVEGQKSFTWYLDGQKQSGGTGITASYEKIEKAYVLVDNNGLKGQVNCNITNQLIYNFEYDANNTKPFIGCNTYTASDKTRLESILKNAVSEAGYGTRAGVEAARFLVGGLKYKIAYLGPKKNDYRLGRYSQVGLNIASNTGWGCSFSGWTQGMDCTNFVGWAFIQAGLELKSVYSTSNVYSIRDVVSKLQVGDLLLTPGGDSFTHVGIIIGIDSSSIYVAEATTGSINAIVTTRMDKNNLPTSGKFSKARLYEYTQNGNVTNMWVS